MRKVLLSLIFLTGLTLSAMAQCGSVDSDHLRLSGYGQLYYDAAFGENASGRNTFGLGKTNLILSGHITDDWSMCIMTQLNSPVLLKELWTKYTFIPELSVRVGQMKTPFALGQQTSPSKHPLTTGSATTAAYFGGIAGDPLYQGTSGRDIGLELSGDFFGRVLSYQLMVMNGQGMNKTDLGTTKGYSGALYIRPYRGITIHTSYLGGNYDAMGSRDGFIDGQEYARRSASIGMSLDFAPISVSAEYIRCLVSSIDGATKDIDVTSDGVYLIAVGHLPKDLELIGSADYLRTDVGSGHGLLTATLGIQRWLADKCRIQLEYRLTDQTGDGVDTPVGHSIRTQLQLGF